MARDRVESNGFPLTQEFAAMMLGASRPTVSVVAGTLQKAGLIKYHRGHVTILDGDALEEAFGLHHPDRGATGRADRDQDRACGHQVMTCGIARRARRSTRTVTLNARSRRRFQAKP